MTSHHETMLHSYIAQTENALEQFLTQAAARDPSSGSIAMQEVMRYSLHDGGKRIRPVLTLAFCAACGQNPLRALRFACALEMIHTYSLIHDDLPAMDDDDLRRGKPASHKQFGEASAILAGDGLLTLAFETLLNETGLPAETVNKAGMLLARASGFCGMIAGQAMDLANENKQTDEATLCETNVRKTGALIAAACELGCLAAQANSAQLTQARQYAESLGLAFQIQDDILDVTANQADLGKPVGSDAAQQKSTYITLLGMRQAAQRVQDFTQQAKAALHTFPQSGFLEELADTLAGRDT